MADGGLGGLLDPSDPAVAQLLGAVAGLGQAAQTSRLPVTAGSVWGSLAGGLMQGATQGQALRTAQAQQLADAMRNQAGYNQLGLAQGFYGQPQSTPADLAANRLQQLNLNMPNPGAGGVVVPQTGGPPSAAAPGMTGTASGSAPAGGAALDSIVDGIIRADSGGNPAAKNPNSSASGLGQFIDGTWVDVARRNFPELASFDNDELLKLKTDPDFGRAMTKAYAKENAEGLIAAGVSPTPGNLLLAHQQGPETAIRLLQADPQTPVASILAPAAVKANPQWANMLAGDLVGSTAEKMRGLVQVAQNTTAPMTGTDAAAAGAPNAFSGAPPQGGGFPAAGGAPGGAVPGSVGGSGFGAPGAPGGGFQNLLANPQMRQLMMMSAALPGSIPPAALQYQYSQMLPAGPMRTMAQMSALKAAGYEPVISQRGQPPMYLNPQTLQYQAQMPPGFLEGLSAMSRAQASGPASWEPQTVVGPDGTPFATSRFNAFAPGMPPLQTGLSPQAQAEAEGRGRAAVAYGPAFGSLAPGGAAPLPPIVPGRMGGAPGVPGGAAAGGPPAGAGGIPLGGTAAAEAQNKLYVGLTQAQADADQKRIDTTLQPAADKANDTLATAKLIGDMLPKVQMGWTADLRADGARVLTALGAPPSAVQAFTGTDPSAADVLNKQFLVQSAAAVRVMGAREPGSVIALFKGAYPNLETQPNAARLIENVLMMQAQRTQDEFTLAQAQHNQAIAAVGQGQRYQSLTPFSAQFNSGPHSSANYLRAAQAMSGAPEAWSGLPQGMAPMIRALIPSGSRYIDSAGNTVMKR